MYFLGIHSDELALLSKENGQLRLIQFFSNASDVKPLDILRGREAAIVTGLSVDEVLLRSISLKLKKKREILAALPFQVETLLPYSSEELLLQPALYPTKEGSEVFMVATSKETLKNHLAACEKLSIDPTDVSCIPIALFRFARHFFPKHPSLFVWHQKGDEHLFIAIEKGRLATAHKVKASELPRISAYLGKKYPSAIHLLRVGELATPSPFVQLEPLELISPHLAGCACSIGLALDTAASDHQSVNFRKGVFTSPQTKHRIQRWETRFLAASAAAIFLVLLTGTISIKRKEHAILSATSAPKGRSLKQHVRQLEGKAYEKKKSKISIPTVPNVTEVLSYLSTHPCLSTDCSISHFQYKIVKSPKLGSTAKSYSAKVELEVATDHPAKARAFHQALLKDRNMIDQKKEVKWSTEYGVYRTTFYLKERRR